MRKIKWACSTGYANCRYEGEFEVDDDTTDEEISEMVSIEIANYIEWGWEEVND